MRAVLLILLLIFFNPIFLHAQEVVPSDLLPTGNLDLKNVLENGNYKLEIKPFRPDEVDTPQLQEKETLSPSDRTTFNQQGYLIRSVLFTDSQDKTSESYEGGIKVSLKNARIDLGSIPQDTLIIKDVDTTTSADSLYGYTLTAIQSEPLMSNTGDQLSPTICDTDELCTVNSAGVWKEEDSFGWGYSIIGKGSPTDFKSTDHYRPFKQATSVVLSQLNNVKGTNSTQLRFKIIVPQSIPEGTYSTILRLFLFPSQ